jgi:hypothetical protein
MNQTTGSHHVLTPPVFAQNEARRKRLALGLALSLTLAAILGCEGGSGVDVQAPGVDVKAGPGGVSVDAPGSSVKVGPGGVQVKAPGADVEVK